MGLPLFANKTSANNWRNSSGCIGESSLDFRQLANFNGVYWRKFTVLSPVNTRQYQDIPYESSALHVLRMKLHAHPYEGNLNSSLYFREKSNSQSHMFDEHSLVLARVHKVYWRKYTGCSSIGESSWGTLAKV
jgi:hypothetical protein